MNFGGFYFSGPIEVLRKEGFRVVVPDQIGFGRSSKPIIPYNFHDMALNSRKLLQSLGDRQGHDRRPLDGRDAVRALRRIVPRYHGARRDLRSRSASPIRATSGRGAAPTRPTRPPWRRPTISAGRDSTPISAATFPSPGAWKPEYEQYVRILYAPTLSGDWPRLAMVRSIYQQMLYLDPVVYDWAKIKVKTLVIGGEKDGAGFPKLAKHIADTIPGAELVIIPNAGHVPHLEVPDSFYPPLLKFVKAQ